MLQSKRAALTLVEVIVCIFIILIVIGMFLPAVRRIREPANRMKCSNNFKQLMLGMHNYADNHPSKDKSGALFPFGCVGPGNTPEERLSWMVSLLPFIEQDSLYKQFKIDSGYAGNLGPAETSITEFRCPSTPEKIKDPRLTNYFAISGIGIDAANQPAGVPGNGFMGYDRETTIESIKDGLSNTIALTETQIDLGPWARGGTSTVRGFDADDLPLIWAGRPLGGHKSLVNVAFADGSVRFIRATIDPKIWAALVTMAGGEEIPKVWDSK